MIGKTASTRPVRWLDVLGATAVLIAAEGELSLTHSALGPRWWEAALLAVISLSLIWWRSHPLLCAGVSACGVALLGIVGNAGDLNMPMVVLFVPPFAIGRYEPVRRSQLGLAVCLVGPAVLSLETDAALASWLFAFGMVGASWATGRAVRNRVMHSEELAARARWLIAEADSRAALAVAEERTRIARQLNTVVVAGVHDMVEQAAIAQRWLNTNSARANSAMVAIETAGHRALAQMRTVLGDLRDCDQSAELAPQPSIGQLGTLVDGGKDRIALRVQGNAGPVPDGVDLAVYRTTQEALRTLAEYDAPNRLVAVDVVYRQGDLMLRLSLDNTVPLMWPTPVMCEWAALAGGELVVDDRIMTATFSRLREDSFS